MKTVSRRNYLDSIIALLTPLVREITAQNSGKQKLCYKDWMFCKIF